jgi:hypothetical protein
MKIALAVAGGGALGAMAVYMVASVLLSLIGIFGGMRIFRVILT